MMRQVFEGRLEAANGDVEMGGLNPLGRKLCDQAGYDFEFVVHILVVCLALDSPARAMRAQARKS